MVEVLRSGWVMQGPRALAFERAFAAYVGAPHAVAVSSGTAAIHLALVAAGIGAGDEVICPSLSFIATANAIVHAGARPVFAEVDERTYNLTADTVAARIGKRVKAILAVHQVGLPAELDALRALADERRVVLIEDAACAVGSSYRGRRIGAPHGLAACFSFHPRKVLTCGEGGMVTTADAHLAARVRALRQHGQTKRGYDFGYNFRMTDLQAAIGLVQLGKLDAMLLLRRAQAKRYDEALPSGMAPFVPAGGAPNYQSYVIRARGNRDALVSALDQAGIATRPGIMASHLCPPFDATRVDLRLTESLAAETLALPLYHQMTDDDQDRVVAAIRSSTR